MTLVKNYTKQMAPHSLNNNNCAEKISLCNITSSYHHYFFFSCISGEVLGFENLVFSVFEFICGLFAVICLLQGKCGHSIQINLLKMRMMTPFRFLFALQFKMFSW